MGPLADFSAEILEKTPPGSPRPRTNKYDTQPVNRAQEEARRVRQAERLAAKWRGEV